VAQDPLHKAGQSHSGQIVPAGHRKRHESFMGGPSRSGTVLLALRTVDYKRAVRDGEG